MQILDSKNRCRHTAWTHSETTLNPGNVNVNKFGRLFKTSFVRAVIYAQPLYVPQLDF